MKLKKNIWAVLAFSVAFLTPGLAKAQDSPQYPTGLTLTQAEVTQSNTLTNFGTVDFDDMSGQVVAIVYHASW